MIDDISVPPGLVALLKEDDINIRYAYPASFDFLEIYFKWSSHLEPPVPVSDCVSPPLSVPCVSVPCVGVPCVVSIPCVMSIPCVSVPGVGVPCVVSVHPLCHVYPLYWCPLCQCPRCRCPLCHAPCQSPLC